MKRAPSARILHLLKNVIPSEAEGPLPPFLSFPAFSLLLRFSTYRGLSACHPERSRGASPAFSFFSRLFSSPSFQHLPGPQHVSSRAKPRDLSRLFFLFSRLFFSPSAGCRVLAIFLPFR